MVRHAAPRGLGKHCHCCRQKRPTAELIPCGASQGEGGAKHGPWCHRCILTKLHKNLSFIAAATTAARRGIWRCPRCDDVCPCNKCIQRRSKDGRQRRSQNKLRHESDELEHGMGIEELHISKSSDADGACTPGASEARDTASASQDDEAYEGALGLCAILKKDGEDSHSRSLSQSSDVPTSQQENSVSAQEQTQELGYSPSNEQLTVHCSEEKEDHASLSETPWTPRKSRSASKRDAAAARNKGASEEYQVPSSAERGKTKEDYNMEPEAEEAVEIMIRHKLPRYSSDAGERQTLSQDSDSPGPAIRGSRSFTYQTQDINVCGRWNVGHGYTQSKPGVTLSAGAFQYPMAKDVGVSSPKERIVSLGRMPSTSMFSPRSASVPHTPIRRKLSRKGIPSRGDSGIEFSPLLDSSSPREPCKPLRAVSPCVLPRPAAELPVNIQLTMHISAPGLRTEERSASEVSIEKLETLRPGSSKEDDATSSFRKSVQRRLPDEVKASGSPGTPGSDAKSGNLPGDCSTSRPALPFQEQVQSDKKVAAAVAAALRLCVPEIADSGESSNCKTSSSSSDYSEGVGGQGDSGSPRKVAMKEESMRPDFSLRCHFKRMRRRAPRQPRQPRVSPYNLPQEKLVNDPWKLLLASMILADNSPQTVQHGIWRFFEELPSADDVLSSDVQKLEQILLGADLDPGLAKKLLLFTKAYASGGWANVTDLPGVDRYVADAYAIFCEGQLQSVYPDDDLLLKYKTWALAST